VRGVVGKPSRRVVSIVAWWIVAVGAALILIGAFVPGRLVISVVVGGLVLAALGFAVFVVGLLRY